MEMLPRESLVVKMIELCPEIEEMALYTVVVGRGTHY
ncbi:hypothetical protein EDC27_1799 [Desulfosoma caldarium]|uniref:Uncharacterized protein n=1 Tax=Desulfosoma caldarium TaxID=610254 RepID=A0A3N1UU90_9BACT|nr:hypothetical protein EDC27_1799 [Desulfosoma caldarium]